LARSHADLLGDLWTVLGITGSFSGIVGLQLRLAPKPSLEAVEGAAGLAKCTGRP
jgi:hypothetical protein